MVLSLALLGLGNPGLNTHCLLVDSVIFGRGEPTRKHPGNVQLRNHVSARLEEYMNSSKSHKSIIIRAVVEELDRSGARYLVPKDPSCRQAIFSGGCREATRSEVRSKVSHAFRDGERRFLLSRKNEGDEEHDEDAKVASVRQEQQSTPKGAWSMSPLTSNEPCTQAGGGKFVHVTVTLSPKRSSSTKEKTPVEKSPAHRTSSTSGPHIIVEEFKSSQESSEKPRLEEVETNDATTAATHSPSFELPTKPGPAPAVISEDYRETSREVEFASILTSLRASSNNNTAGTELERKKGSSPEKWKSPASPLKKRGRKPKNKEESKPISVIVQNLATYCRPVDVVFGRGAPLRQHPGNIKFRGVVSKYNHRYSAASKHEKTEIIQNVIKELQMYGAKFLIMGDDEGAGVTQASPGEIRMKVSHRFRDFTKGKSSNKKRGLGEDEIGDATGNKKAKRMMESDADATTMDPNPTHANPTPNVASRPIEV